MRLVVAVAGLVSAALFLAGGRTRFWILIFLTAWAAVGILSYALASFVLKRKPIFGLYFVVAEVVFLHIALLVAAFGGAAAAIAWASNHYTTGNQKYFVGAGSGFALATIAIALVQVPEGQSSIGSHVQKQFRKVFNPFFLYRDPSVNEWVGGPRARWRPDGKESFAVQEENYDDEFSGRVSGWGWSARHARAHTLEHGLKRTPDN